MAKKKEFRPGWTRLNRSAKDWAPRYRHDASGWKVEHCGHPTANWPYSIESPMYPGRLYVSCSGRGFGHLQDAMRHVEEFLAGNAVSSCCYPGHPQFGDVYSITTSEGGWVVDPKEGKFKMNRNVRRNVITDAAAPIPKDGQILVDKPVYGSISKVDRRIFKSLKNAKKFAGSDGTIWIPSGSGWTMYDRDKHAHLNPPALMRIIRNPGGLESSHCVIYVGLDKGGQDKTPDILFCGDENECWLFIQRHQGQSYHYATTYGGYSIQPMPFANNPGNPMNFYKPSPAVCRRNPLKFSDKRTREDFIEILVGLDPNGVWTDADNIAEGYEPLTREGALSAIRKIVSRDYE